MPGAQPAPPERGLRDHVGVLRRRAALIIGLTALAVAAALVVSLRQPTLYQAKAEVLYHQETGSVEDPAPDQMVQSKRLDPARVIQNETRVAGSRQVRDVVEARLGGSVTATAENVRDSDIIVITATAATPERAADIANAWAQAYVEVTTARLTERASEGVTAVDQQLRAIDDRLAAIAAALSGDPGTPDRRAQLTGEQTALETQRGAWLQQRSRLAADQALAAESAATVVNPATPPSSPSQPAIVRNLLLSLVVGFLFALLVAYAVDQLDDTVRRAEDLERAVPLPVVAVVPGATRDDEPRVIGYDDPILRVDPKRATAIVADASPDTTILLVPVGTRARRVRRDVEVLARLGSEVAACALWVPGDLPPAPAPGERATLSAR